MNSVDFIQQLQDRMVLGGIDLAARDGEVVRIQIGKDVAFKGVIQDGSLSVVSDRLSESQIASLSQVLSVSESRSDPVMQSVMASRLVANFQQLKDLPISDVYDEYADDIAAAYELFYSPEEFEYPDYSFMPVKSFLRAAGVEPEQKNPSNTINIDLGSDRIFRYSGKAKQVEIDSFNPFTVRVEEPVKEPVSVEPVAAQDQDITGQTAATPVVEPEPVVEREGVSSGVSNISGGVTHIQARVQEVVGEVVGGVKARVGEAMSIAAGNIAETVEKNKQILPEPVVQILDEAADKVPAAAIALVELHDSLKEPAREWLMSRFEEVRESGLVQQLPEKGSEFVRSLWGKVQQMGQDVKERAIADSVVALTKEFGEVDANNQFVYRAEEFTVRVKGLNQYHVEDRNGQEILSFKYDRLTGPKDVQGRMSFADQVSFVRAGGELTRDRMAALAGATGEGLQQLTTALGNLAPAGTRQRLEAFKQRQVSAVAQMMLKTNAAVETVKGKVFTGERFKFVSERDSGAIQVFKNEPDRQPEKVFEQIGQAVRSRLEEPDVQSLINAGKAFAKAHSAARAKASQKKESVASQR
ncbi:MAG: hypothetical protein D6694_07040 [Gammaproteobacteria bacterium]|nr:MAG: hypothetical protein D6694_07040 [Gammaproteobacteria bacterium]